MKEVQLNRRALIAGASALSLTAHWQSSALGQAEPGPVDAPLAIATWNFGQIAVDRALKTLSEGGTTLDAVEQGIRDVESSGGTSVGLTGKPNAAGFVQLDACIMDGPGHRAGSVAGLEGIVHPISAARKVMEQTRHVMLVGDGARAFALKCGLESVPIDGHEAKAQAWWKQVQLPQPQQAFHPPVGARDQARPADDHDTVTLLVLGKDGTISGGCSTSGLADKFHGRVGDSPILCSGLYVDNEVGAAGGTGIGENIMRYGASLLIVEAMRRGATPTQACHEVLQRIMRSEPPEKVLDIYFIALDKQGRYGAAGTQEFPHAVAYPGFSQILTSPPFTPPT